MSLLSNLKPGLTGLEQVRALLAAGRQPSIHQTLDIALIAADEGTVIVEAHPSDKHLNPAGTVGGGYIATILDTACACAAHTGLPSQRVSACRLNVTRFSRLNHADTVQVSSRTAA